ncbi:uncharacterized protein LOC122250683 [Penaeus japonicus]|uniref:uncharacterized protein LOC122250683 n=1 Tax=Penaeus japonicus TaxID=27405 RepID=UPI001C715D1F|nr:uncharacterized protein LOC122250683 [Penaeus japonicus]
MRNRNNFLCVLWSVVVFSFFGIMLFLLVNALSDFLQRKILTQTQQKKVTTGEIGLPLPDVMICNRGFFSKAKLQAMNIDAELSSYLMMLLAGPGISVKNLFTSTEGEQTLDDLQRSLEKTLEERNMTLPELIAAVSYTCEEVISRCEVISSRSGSTECCQRMITVPTYLGYCLLWPSYYEERQVYGDQKVQEFYLKVPTNDTPEFSPKVLTLSKMVKSGLQVTIAGNLTYQGMLVFSQGTLIPPGTHTNIRLSLTKINNKDLRTWADVFEEPCVPPESLTGLDSLLKISSNCFDGAVYNCFSEICECYAFYNFNATGRQCTLRETSRCLDLLFYQIGKMSRTLAFEELKFSPSQEVLQQIQKCWEREKSRCVTACEELSFSYVAHTVPMMQETVDVLGEEFDLDNTTQIAVVSTSYPNMDYIEIWSTRQGLNDILGVQGCYIGFFLGASLFTALESSVYATLIWWKLCRWVCRGKGN